MRITSTAGGPNHERRGRRGQNFTRHDVRNPKILTGKARGDNLGIADRHKGESEDGLGQNIEGGRNEGGVVIVEDKNVESALGQMSERRGR